MDKYFVVFYDEKHEKKFEDLSHPYTRFSYSVNVTVICLVQIAFFIYHMIGLNFIPLAFALSTLIISSASIVMIHKFPTKQGLFVMTYKLILVIISIENMRRVKSEMSPAEGLYWGCSLCSLIYIIGAGPSPFGFVANTIFEVLCMIYFCSLYFDDHTKSTIPLINFLIINVLLNMWTRYQLERFIRKIFLLKENSEKQVEAYKYMVQEALPGFSMIINNKKVSRTKSKFKNLGFFDRIFSQTVSKSTVKRTEKDLEAEILSSNRNFIEGVETMALSKEKEIIKNGHLSVKNMLLEDSSAYISVEYSREKAKQLYNINSKAELVNFLETVKITKCLFPQTSIYNNNKEILENKNALELVNFIYYEGENAEKRLKHQSFKNKRKESRLSDSNQYSKTVIKGYLPKLKDEKLFIEIKLCKFHIGKKPGVFLLIDDLSAEEEIKFLRSLDHFKDRVLANVTHDLRTPLNGLIIF